MSTCEMLRLEAIQNQHLQIKEKRGALLDLIAMRQFGPPTLYN